MGSDREQSVFEGGSLAGSGMVAVRIILASDRRRRRSFLLARGAQLPPRPTLPNAVGGRACDPLLSGLSRRSPPRGGSSMWI